MLLTITWIQDFPSFHAFWEQTLLRFRDYFQEQVFSIYFELRHFRLSYLSAGKQDRIHFEVTGSGGRVMFDSLDFRLLSLLAPKARMPLSRLAKAVRTTPAIVRYRLKRLISEGIVQGFRTNIDFSKLGYQHFKVDIFLRDYRTARRIEQYITFNPHLVYIDKSAGLSDLEMEFHVENLQQLHAIMEDLVTRFSGSIKNYRYFNISKVHKIQYMPQL